MKIERLFFFLIHISSKQNSGCVEKYRATFTLGDTLLQYQDHLDRSSYSMDHLILVIL